ncbi:MAG: zinc-ribbon domain containing protein [Chloroflexi bacterium]|nr:zinc-ribbon domain containing protein [Chloroflexota bacterium]
MSYQDKSLTCVECGQPFTFSAEDQAFHAQKGYTNEPKRCPSCRDARRASGGGGGFGRGRREMFPAVCAQCGKDTQVPFQPRGDRPVYCSDCYSRQNTGSRRF